MVRERAAKDQIALDDRPVELLIQLLKLSSFINGPMQDGVASPSGLAPIQVKITLCLGGEGALAGHEISDIMGLAPMNVSRALASLQERGWIELVDDPRSRRRKPFQLSALGWQGHRAMLPDIGKVASFLFDSLTARERKVMLSASGKIVDRMADWLDEHHAGLNFRHLDES